jgi:putative nucleotidyltransferase with HDIG domain
MPALCKQVLTHMNDPNMDFKSLAETVRYDPGMTANILKLANSSYFGTTRKIESLQAAMVRLGAHQLFQMAVATGVAKLLNRRLAGYGLESSEFLRHSVWAAVAAEELARQMEGPPPDMLFTAGLLHDIGKVVMDEFMNAQSADIRADMGNSTASFDGIEEKVFGLTHAEVGAEVLDQWNLPEALVAAVRCHHIPDQAGDHSRLTMLVHLADMLAYSEGMGTGLDGMRYHVAASTAKQMGIRTPVIERVAGRTLERMRELEGLLTRASA